jgi:hypothetical protein
MIPASVHAATIAWNAPVDGDWTEESNWDPAMVPGPDDDVVIDALGSYVVTLDASAEIASLTLGAGTQSQRLNVDALDPIALHVSGAIRIALGGAFFLGSFPHGDVVVSSSSTMVNQGTTQVVDSVLKTDVKNEGQVTFRIRSSYSGNFQNLPGSALRIFGSFSTGNSNATFERGFTNQGRMFFFGDMSGTASGDTNLTIESGTLVNAPGAQIRVYNGASHTLNAPIENHGTLTVDRPFTINAGASDNINSGTIEVRDVGDANQGELAINLASAKGNVGGGTLTLNGTLSIDGGRIASFSGGSLFYDPDVDVIGSPTSELTLEEGISVRLLRDMTNGVLTRLVESSLVGPGNLINLATFVADEAFLDTDIENRQRFTFEKECSLTGEFQNLPGATLRLFGSWFMGPAVVAFDRGFTNNGAMHFLGDRLDGSVGNTSLTLATGTLVNSTGASIRAYDAGVHTIDAPKGVHTIDAPMRNYGDLLVDRPLNLNLTGSSNINQGTIEIRDLGEPNQGELILNMMASKGTILGGTYTNSGIVRTATDRPLTLSNGSFLHTGGVLEGMGVLEVETGSRLFGIAPIDMDVNNGGEINPGLPIGSLTIDADYTQTTPGKLNIEIGGLGAGTEFDRLIVNGTATLNGQMNVVLVDDFVPAPLDRFEVLPYQNRNGTFNSINGLVPGIGVVLFAFYEPMALVLEAEGSLDPPRLLDLITRFLGDRTEAEELVRRSRTWLQN